MNVTKIEAKKIRTVSRYFRQNLFNLLNIEIIIFYETILRCESVSRLTLLSLEYKGCFLRVRISAHASLSSPLFTDPATKLNSRPSPLTPQKVIRVKTAPFKIMVFTILKLFFIKKEFRLHFKLSENPLKNNAILFIINEPYEAASL